MNACVADLLSCGDPGGVVLGTTIELVGGGVPGFGFVFSAKAVAADEALPVADGFAAFGTTMLPVGGGL